tara:strand:- start:89741 stop:90727 length:987 start_codon:yes stop_codon:yes gene_type:complete
LISFENRKYSVNLNFNKNVITMTIPKSNIAFLIFASIISLLTACSGNEPEQDTEVQKTDTTVNKEISAVTKVRIEKTQKIFYSVPSPAETADMFKKAGLEYNKDILNPYNNVSKYSTQFAKAINLGVYGADLSYANIFEQTQESMLYMNCAKKLADELGVSGAFDAATMERFEENVNNKDSLLSLISDTYWVIDDYLKENDQEETAALIIVGGWIEGLYLGTAMLDENMDNTELMQRIAEQKYSFENLMGLLNSFENNPNIDRIKEMMKPLEEAFAKINLDAGETTATTNDEGVTTIGSTNENTNVTAEQILGIKNAVTQIRNQFIQF